jgi:hypothetical protein
MVAARQVTPSYERKWKIPTKPKGDEWEVPLIIRVPTKEEVIGIMNFFREYYLGLGALGKGFIVDNVEQVSDTEIKLTVRLSPYEAQITQTVNICVLRSEEKYVLDIYLKRLTGTRNIWANSNITFLDDLRKQLLVWRTLSPEQQRRYIEQKR